MPLVLHVQVQSPNPLKYICAILHSITCAGPNPIIIITLFDEF